MADTKFTPGPWSTEIDDEGRESSEVRAGCSLIAIVYGSLDFPCLTDEDTEATAEEMAANAHLIAAAPDLYEALERIEAIMRESRGIAGYHLNGNEMPWAELDPEGKIAAALQKARGEA